MIFLLFTLLITPTFAIENNVNEQINSEYLLKVKPIFQKSCFDCHSDKTVFPKYYKIPGIKHFIDKDIKEGKEEVDFSNDFPFTGKDSASETLENIAKELNENEMPPFLYTFMHKEAKMTEADKLIVLKWTEDSIALLKQAPAEQNPTEKK